MSLLNRRLVVVRGEPGRCLVLLLVILAWLAAGCAPPARVAEPRATTTGTPQARQLTILYTGYGRGQVDPAHPADCG